MPVTAGIQMDHQSDASGGPHLRRPSSGIGDEATRKEEQKSAMQRVREGKTLYDMLGVSRTAPYSEIVKSYRKLALLLHPDKNKVSGAAECFKAVARAFKVLSDNKSRAEYDLSLSQPAHSHRNGQRYVFRRNHSFNVWTDDEDEFCAEAFFNAFFASHTGLAFPTTRRHYRTSTYNATRVQRDEPFVLKFIAMAILVALMLMSTLLTPEHAYQFSPSLKYNTRRTTPKLNVNYYVQPDFSLSADDVQSFEAEVELSYMALLQRQCHEEQDRRLRSFIKGSGRTPSCDLYRTLMSRA